MQSSASAAQNGAVPNQNESVAVYTGWQTLPIGQSTLLEQELMAAAWPRRAAAKATVTLVVALVVIESVDGG